MEREKVHVCYSLHDADGTYAKFLGTSMCSMFENTKSWVVVHLLHDETLTEPNRERIIKLVRSYGHEVHFYKTALPEEFDVIMRQSKLSPATFYRLGLGTILPGDVARVVYLDADTVVNLDIARLWSEDVRGAELSAVPDFGVINVFPYSAAMIRAGMIKRETYFNAGVLVIDMEKFRQRNDFFMTAMQFFRQNYKLCSYLDQDILNYFFQDKYHALPQEYNTFIREAKQQGPAPMERIYHYAGRSLGFDPENRFDSLFWDYFVKTPWCDGSFMIRTLRATHKAMDIGIMKSASVNKVMKGRRRHIWWGKRELLEIMRQNIPAVPDDEFIESGEDAGRGVLNLGTIKKYLDENSPDMIVVLMTAYYGKVRSQLVSLGYVEGKHFIDGRLLIGSKSGLINEYEVIKEL